MTPTSPVRSPHTGGLARQAAVLLGPIGLTDKAASPVHTWHSAELSDALPSQFTETRYWPGYPDAAYDWAAWLSFVREQHGSDEGSTSFAEIET